MFSQFLRFVRNFVGIGYHEVLYLIVKKTNPMGTLLLTSGTVLLSKYCMHSK